MTAGTTDFMAGSLTGTNVFRTNAGSNVANYHAGDLIAGVVGSQLAQAGQELLAGLLL